MYQELVDITDSQSKAFLLQRNESWNLTFHNLRNACVKSKLKAVNFGKNGRNILSEHRNGEFHSRREEIY